jgi:hypothetical protein
MSFSLLTWHCFALALMDTNFSTSVISDGIVYPSVLVRCDGCKTKFLSVLVWDKNLMGNHRFIATLIFQFACINIGAEMY